MYNSDKIYQEKYLKYKTKYLKLKNLAGGNPDVKFNILVITFNLGSKSEIDLQKLNTLIQNEIKYLSDRTPPEQLDFIAISLQECYVGIGAKAFSIDLSNYELKVSKSMKQGTLGSMYLFIYQLETSIYSIIIKKSSYNIIPCEKYSLKVIPLKVPLFKGGIIANLHINLKDPSINKPILLTIVGSHLPSKQTKPEYRDKCLNKIISNIAYVSNIIFTGDLNYRAITESEKKLSYTKKIVNKFTTVFNKKEKEKSCEVKNPIITDSLNKDQLIRSLSTNLEELKESKIKFCPTCKLKKSHSNMRDTTIDYDPERVPSWCDRVLYKGKFNPIVYNSINLSDNSDHLAVYQLLQFNSTQETVSTPKTVSTQETVK